VYYFNERNSIHNCLEGLSRYGTTEERKKILLDNGCDIDSVVIKRNFSNGKKKSASR
jgi:hypothetical protein